MNVCQWDTLLEEHISVSPTCAKIEQISRQPSPLSDYKIHRFVSGDKPPSKLLHTVAVMTLNLHSEADRVKMCCPNLRTTLGTDLREAKKQLKHPLTSIIRVHLHPEVNEVEVCQWDSLLEDWGAWR